MVFPVWTLSDVLLESGVSVKELGVAPERGDNGRGRDEITDVLLDSTKGLWLIEGHHFE